MNELSHVLQTRYYANVPFPIKREQILEAVEAFFEFLKLPDSIKSHIDFSIAPKHRRGDVGFRHREGEHALYDDYKDFFHYHPDIFEKYGEFLKEQPIINNFLQKAAPLWEQTAKTVSDILHSLNIPGAYEKIFKTHDNQSIHILLRFLKYEWNASGKYLAKPHFDAGSFTLAIAESCPGLRIGSNPDDLEPVEHKNEHAVFMCASNLRQVIKDPLYKPAWHDVIQVDETKIGQPCARWAVVAFIEALDVEALPREETHKFFKGIA